MIDDCSKMSLLPGVWLQKYFSLMKGTEERPALQDLISLAEWGVKIPYNGPELSTLCEFVLSCIQWRDAASELLSSPEKSPLVLEALVKKADRMTFTCDEMTSLYALFHSQ